MAVTTTRCLAILRNLCVWLLCLLLVALAVIAAVILPSGARSLPIRLEVVADPDLDTLLAAIEEIDEQTLRNVLSRRRDLDLNYHDRDGHVSLTRAARVGWTLGCRLLLERGADARAVTSNGQTTVMCGLIAPDALGNVEMLDLLVRHGADVNRPDRYGNTALIQAATFDRVATLEYLIAAGADVNAVRPDGVTALHCAALCDSYQCAVLLLAAGADRAAKDLDGALPLDIAAPQSECARLLANAPAKSAKRSADR